MHKITNRKSQEHNIHSSLLSNELSIRILIKSVENTNKMLKDELRWVRSIGVTKISGWII